MRHMPAAVHASNASQLGCTPLHPTRTPTIVGVTGVILTYIHDMRACVRK